MNATARQGPLVEQIIQHVKTVGLAVTSMPEIPTVFYVFDVQFDSGDARVYSSDPKLAEFKKARKQLELGVNGDTFLGEEPVLKGEVEIDSKAVAMRMGVDYGSLLARGFWLTIVREITAKEHMERSVLRKVREKIMPYGMLVTDLQIGSITVSTSTGSGVDDKAGLPKLEKNTATSPTSVAAPMLPQVDTGSQRTREQLCIQLNELRGVSNPQRRGYELESFLNELFALEGLRPRGPFRIVGEQIDGSFVWRDRTYLLEAKWTSLPAAGAQFGAFGFKLDGKTADTRGLFVSVDGYTSDGLAALRTKGCLKFVCLDGEHLAAAVKPSGSLLNILDQVWRHADETGEPHVSASKLRC
ncbi:MAG: hypothetical protein V1929_06435 [bacterium]